MAEALDYITGIGGLIANPISTLINNHHNEQLIREQNERNLEQWNRENFYNSPAEQLKRLKVAGLNPNLMYGNGAGSLLSAPSPTMQASRTEVPQVDPLTMAQIRNLDADTEKKQGENRRADEQQSEIIQNLQQTRINMRAEVDKMDSETELNFATITLNNARLALDQRSLDESVKLWNSEIAKNNADAQMTNEMYSQVVALYELRKEGIELSNREIQSRIGVNNATAKQLNKMCDLYQSEIEKNSSEKSFVDKQNKWFATNSKAQNALLKSQEEYWRDYKSNPSKYRPHTTSDSHNFSGSSSGFSGGSSHSETN